MVTILIIYVISLANALFFSFDVALWGSTYTNRKRVIYWSLALFFSTLTILALFILIDQDLNQ